MAKTPIREADRFTTGLLKHAMERLQVTDSPVTTFRFGDIEFQLTLKRLDGTPVLSRGERQLVRRVEKGQDDLSPQENRMAHRILAKRRL